MCDSETWVLTKREENRFLVFERKFLCTIFDPKILVGVYSNRCNFQLDGEFNSSNVIVVVKNNRLRYVGHMIRGAEDLPQRALYRVVPKGRRNQGRPKSRWADGVNHNWRVRTNFGSFGFSQTGLDQIMVIEPYK
jgi:hypothetical protein